MHEIQDNPSRNLGQLLHIPLKLRTFAPVNTEDVQRHSIMLP